MYSEYNLVKILSGFKVYFIDSWLEVFTLNGTLLNLLFRGFAQAL